MKKILIGEASEGLETLALGVKGLIVKPFTPEKVIEGLEKIE